MVILPIINKKHLSCLLSVQVHYQFIMFLIYLLILFPTITFLYNVFNSSPSSPLFILIRTLFLTLSDLDFEIQFLWGPGHHRHHRQRNCGLFGQIHCVPSTSSQWLGSMVGLQSKSQKISCVNRLWHKSYCNLPPNYTTWCRNINSINLSKPWFHSLKLSRKIIISFSRLHFGHILLPSHYFKLSLNNSPLCIFPSSSGL